MVKHTDSSVSLNNETDGLEEFLAFPSANQAAASDVLKIDLKNNLGNNLKSHVKNDRAFQRILKDLVPSSKRLAAVYVGANVVGYALSLALCAQNGVGVLPLSYRVAASMHIIPWPYCPIVCGALFSLVPNLFVRLFLSPFQQRYLVRRLSWLLALLPLVAAIAMSLTGDDDPNEFFAGFLQQDFSSSGWMLLWTLGALGTSAILEFGFAVVLFRRQFSALLRRHTVVQ